MGLNADAAVTDLMATLRSANPPLTPRGARRIANTHPEDQEPRATNKEAAMPRGVYLRKPRAEKDAGGGKVRRKYTKRPKPAGDVAQLAREVFDDAARNLHATVVAQVEIGDNEELSRALKAFEVADKIVRAAG